MTLIEFEYLSFESYVHSQNRNSFALDCPLNGRSVSLSQISIVNPLHFGADTSCFWLKDILIGGTWLEGQPVGHERMVSTPLRGVFSLSISIGDYPFLRVARISCLWLYHGYRIKVGMTIVWLTSWADLGVKSLLRLCIRSNIILS